MRAPASAPPAAERSSVFNSAFERMAGLRFLPVVRSTGALEALVEVADVLREHGLGLVEYAFTEPQAAAALQAAKQRHGDACLVGAGTVRSPEQARAALEAGADFLVSPDYSPEVARVAREASVGYLPGVFSPGEVGALLDQGHTWLKLFPAGPAGPAYVRALLGPYPQARFMTSGGISLADAPRFLEAGARVVGMTTALVPSHLDAGGAWREELGRRLEQLLG